MLALSAGEAGPARAPLARFGPGDLVLLRGIEGLRWAGLALTVGVVWLRRESLDRPVLAVGLVVVSFAYSVVSAIALRRRDPRLLEPAMCFAGVAIAAALMASDGWVLGWRSTFDPPALGALWALAAVLLVGVASGPRWGFLAGAAVVFARLLGVLAPEVQHGPPSFSSLFQIDRPRLIPTISLLALYGIAGAGAGWLAVLQRRAEEQISAAKARDEVARTLHDGVLQTLALVQRRSADPELVELARHSDADLRAYLASGSAANGSLDASLRTVCAEFSRRFGVTPQLLVDDLPKLTPEAATALSGATAEALANVGKHASARRVTVFAGRPEPGTGVVVTVNDDGIGFDPADAPTDRGLAQSVTARLHEVGGTATIRSSAGEGTEVALWVP